MTRSIAAFAFALALTSSTGCSLIVDFDDPPVIEEPGIGGAGGNGAPGGAGGDGGAAGEGGRGGVAGAPP